jgi:hypothetical protein
MLSIIAAALQHGVALPARADADPPSHSARLCPDSRVQGGLPHEKIWILCYAKIKGSHQQHQRQQLLSRTGTARAPWSREGPAITVHRAWPKKPPAAVRLRPWRRVHSADRQAQRCSRWRWHALRVRVPCRQYTGKMGLEASPRHSPGGQVV